MEVVFAVCYPGCRVEVVVGVRGRKWSGFIVRLWAGAGKDGQLTGWIVVIAWGKLVGFVVDL